MAVVGKEKGVCVVVFFQAFGLTMQLFARVGGAIWIDRHWFVGRLMVPGFRDMWPLGGD